GGVLVGYGHLQLRLDLFNQLAWPALALLAVGHILATSITLNSGGSGGVFAPSLYVGAATGAAFGVAMDALFPELGLRPEPYALVGMGAVFAAATDAPIAALLIVFELTGDYAIIVPLMVAVVIGYRVAKWIEPDSLYSAWLRRRGEELEGGAVVDVLGRLTVSEAVEEDPQVIGEAATVSQLLEHLGDATETEYPVVDRDLRPVGMISITDLGRIARQSGELGDLVMASDIANPTEIVYPED
ncbi:MAG: chloride channel protein, partial [Gammaproteobacteria bacterium]|nr:chloride channel protein [Gemmatimonadota bacterium]NIU78021.1 chloride channel protein [Gammaproteobacteria bacterium]